MVLTLVGIQVANVIERTNVPGEGRVIAIDRVSESLKTIESESKSTPSICCGAVGQVQGCSTKSMVLPEVWREVDWTHSAGWTSCRALEPGEAAPAPKSMADVYNARGKPIIYEYGDHGYSEDGKFCEAAFTYLKRVSLCMTLEGHPVTIENVVKALHTLDKAHFKRLTETLNVENVRFTGLNDKYSDVYRIDCERAHLSVRAVGQMVPVHVPLRPPEPLTIGELLSLVHVLLAMVEPESCGVELSSPRTLTVILNAEGVVTALPGTLEPGR
eukprot:6490993-Amphidinium_carterae.4